MCDDSREPPHHPKSAHAKKRAKNFNFCASWKSPCLVIENLEGLINESCRTLKYKNRTLRKKKQAVQNSVPSPAQHEKTPLLGPSELVSDSPACSNSDEDPTRRESERNYFAGTDIERITLVLRSSGLRCAAFAGTDTHDSARLCKTRLTLNCGCALRTALLNIARGGTQRDRDRQRQRELRDRQRQRDRDRDRDRKRERARERDGERDTP